MTGTARVRGPTDLIRASSLLQKMEEQAADHGATAKLQAGWYSNRIEGLIEADRLEPIAILHDSDDSGDDSSSSSSGGLITTRYELEHSGCAVAMCIGGTPTSPWSDVGGGSMLGWAFRNVPGNVLQG